jgi:hypothetical protein
MRQKRTPAWYRKRSEKFIPRTTYSEPLCVTIKKENTLLRRVYSVRDHDKKVVHRDSFMQSVTAISCLLVLMDSLAQTLILGVVQTMVLVEPHEDLDKYLRGCRA